MLEPSFENVPIGARSPIRWIRRSCDDLSTDHGWHLHPQYELTWFLASAGTRYVADRVERYVPGDLVLSGPNLPHCWRNDTGSAEWISVQFMPDLFGDLLALPEASAVRALLDGARGGLAFRGASPIVEPLLVALGQAQGFLSILRLLETLEALTGLESRTLASADYHSRMVVDQVLVERLDRITRYIAEHFRGVPSQADLASELGMTASAFSKFVRAATGETFSNMVKLARINEACRLLANDDARITDVALECGYQHTSHFDHQFQELKGVTPTEYRRSMRALRETSRKISASPDETRL